MTRKKQWIRNLLFVAITAAAAVATYLIATQQVHNDTSIVIESRSVDGKTYPFTAEEFRSKTRSWDLYNTDLDDKDEEYHRAMFIDKEWRKQAEFISLDRPRSVLVEHWSFTVGDSRDLLTPEQERAALRKLAEHAVARAQQTPERFRDLIDSDPAEVWVEDMAPPAHVGSSQKTLFYDLYLERAYDPDASRQQVLGEVWAGLEQHNHLFEAVGHGSKGADFIVARVRAEAMARAADHSGPDVPQDPGYWSTKSTRARMKFTDSANTVENALKTNDHVLMFYANIIVRLGDGRLTLWRPALFLDPETGRWAFYRMNTSSTMTTMVVG